MPNHYHLVLRPLVDVEMSRFMGWIGAGALVAKTGTRPQTAVTVAVAEASWLDGSRQRVSQETGSGPYSYFTQFPEFSCEICVEANIRQLRGNTVDRNSGEFISLLTSCQPPLYACILSLLPDRVAAQDILQETSITLWHKADDFEAGTNFMAWASRIARYHILNYRRKRKHDKLVFDDELFAELCEQQAERPEDGNRYAEAIRECLSSLPKDAQTLIEERYSSGGCVSQIAVSRGLTAGAVSQMLYRIRETLLNCVSQQLQEEPS